MNSSRFRLIGPFLLITLCLLSLCAIMAVSLFRQQESIARLLKDHVQGRRAALQLKECLGDIITLEDNRNEDILVLHDRVRHLLRDLKTVADHDDERDLHACMDREFQAYLTAWGALPPLKSPEHEPARRKATRHLEEKVLEPCERFISANTLRIEQSSNDHERILRQHAWGLVVVGGLGSIAGGVFGFGVARNLQRTLTNLRVQVRDATDKLVQNPPEIILSGHGDLKTLRSEIDVLSSEISATVSKLQQREMEVLRARQLAAVGQLAAGVGHEIRNPLTSIKLLVQTAISDSMTLSPEDLAIIDTEILRMEHSLKTFLEFARPPIAERQAVAMPEVIDGVVRLIKGRAMKQMVMVDTTAVEAVMLDADPMQLRQVLLNLAMNALDAMPLGGELTFTARKHGNNAVIDVLDTGPGIDAAVATRLFEPFVSGKETGLGLGLVISQRIIAEHGGTIAVERTSENKTVFTIVLPLAGTEM